MHAGNLGWSTFEKRYYLIQLKRSGQDIAEIVQLNRACIHLTVNIGLRLSCVSLYSPNVSERRFEAHLEKSFEVHLST